MSIYPVQPIHPFLNHSHPTTTSTTTTRVRPTLKRSQSPFTSDLLDNNPTTDRKKQRTSPTCNAFAKLSLTSPPISTEASQPTLIPLLNPKPKLQPETNQDQRMRSVYSAYDIGPDRIFVDSLGSEPSSPIEPECHEPFEDSNQTQLRVACQVPISRIALPTPLLQQDQQLVLYRPPVHLTLNQPFSSSTAKHPNQSGSDSFENLNVDVDVDVPMELD